MVPVEGEHRHEHRPGDARSADRQAAQDPEFRAGLTRDPHAAVREALGVEVPEGLNIQVREESAQTAYLVLPPDASLTEEDLRGACGAIDWSWPGSGFRAPRATAARGWRNRRQVRRVRGRSTRLQEQIH